jgi:hypothetical protein
MCIFSIWFSSSKHNDMTIPSAYAQSSIHLSVEVGSLVAINIFFYNFFVELLWIFLLYNQVIYLQVDFLFISLEDPCLLKL